jgi:hypothetical protein
MSDDPVTAREMIAAYRATVRPTHAAKDRMAQALAAASVAPVIPLRPAPPRRTAPAVWLALAAALALVVASTYWLASARHGQQGESPGLLMAPHEDPSNSGTPEPRTDEPAPPSPAPRDDSPAPADEPAEVPSTIITPAIDPPAPPTTEAPARRPRPRPTDQPAAAPVDPVLAELELVQRIKDALDGARPADALRLIDRHVRTFARGSLVEERDALRVTALCAAGKRADGLREQQAFLGASPRSAYRDRVRAACAD